MDSYKYSCLSDKRRYAGRVGRFCWPCRLLLASALAVLALGAFAAPARVRAASNAPTINFAAPVYAGQNNGNAEGPVGALVTLQGSNWAPNSTIPVRLVDSQYDTGAGGPGMACISSSPSVPIPGNPPQTDGNGAFTLSFQWPAAANAVGHSYWACGAQAGATFPGVGTLYTVLSAHAPSLSIGGVTSVPVSGSITVTGQNWLPGNQQITVAVVPCLACDGPPLQTTTVAAKPDGSFSTTISLSSQAAVGATLYVIAANQSSDPSQPPALNVNSTGAAPQFTVVNQPTPTPSPSPTATNTPVPTNVPGGTGTGSNTSSNGLLIVLLAALGVVLLLAAIVAVLLFVRSRRPALVPGGPPYGGPGDYPPAGYSQYSGPRRTAGSGPASDYTNAEYYDPPRAGGRSGPPAGYGQRGGWAGPDEGGSGDDPTIGMNTPWQR